MPKTDAEVSRMLREARGEPPEPEPPEPEPPEPEPPPVKIPWIKPVKISGIKAGFIAEDDVPTGSDPAKAIGRVGDPIRGLGLANYAAISAVSVGGSSEREPGEGDLRLSGTDELEVYRGGVWIGLGRKMGPHL